MRDADAAQRIYEPGYKIWRTLRNWKMEVDMSPEAITNRLLTMEQLWQLSIELMCANEIKDLPETTPSISTRN